MKNLVLLKEQRLKFRNAVGACHVDDGIRESIIMLSKDGLLVEQGSWEQNLDGNDWFRVTFVDPQIVCLSKKGAIVSVQPESGDWELVGEFDNGILDGKWSPDAEVLALITLTEGEDGQKNCVLLTMSADFDVLGEIILEAFDSDAPVSIEWRPDGTLLAVNSLESSDNVRRIRTYQRESLTLNSVGRSEDGSGKLVPNLQETLAWASSGCSNLIASVQRKSKRTQQVVFFEPNGLRHREFLLRSPTPEKTVVKSLCWNALSDILAVLTEQEDGPFLLQLWHRSNYHWYLKYEWQYNEKVHCIQFHNEKPYRLFVTLGEEIREYECCWDVSSYHILGETFTAISIDGQKLNSTPFHKALVPPPMYASTITFNHCICSVSFNGKAVIAYLSNGSFVLLSHQSSERNNGHAFDSCFEQSSGQEILKWDEDTLGIEIQSLRHIVIVEATETHIDLIAAAPFNWLVDIRVSLTDSKAKVSNKAKMESQILRIVNWSDCSKGALIELEDGELLEYLKGSAVPSCTESLLEPCPWIAGVYDTLEMKSDEACSSQDRLIVGLSFRSRLYCHDRLLSDSVSSFMLSTAHKFLHLVTSGADCQLRSLALTSLHNFDPFMGSEENDMEGYELRKVERGAKLVAILPSSPTAILQMPRGNLEGIYPRSLVLPYVMSKIELGQYGLAISMMRRQKVDLNLAVDLNPNDFLDNGVIQLVEDVRKVDVLNLFISTLQNSDVTVSRYRIPSWFIRKRALDEATLFDFMTKVNMVCQRIRQLLIETEQRGSTTSGINVEDGYYLLPILTTFAKESPPKLEEALAMIRENAKKQHIQTSKKQPLFSDKAQSSIQYLAFLSSYELLFNTALGMYDYELARAVARNSQMDPKVYLPLLKRLKSLPNFYAKYEVDVDLKRYESALSNLFQSCLNEENLDTAEQAEDKIFGNSFIQCLELVEKHKLYQPALRLYKNNGEKRSQIMQSLGKSLMGEGKYQAALSIFLSVEPPNLDDAKLAAKKCGDWQYFFTHFPRDCSKSDSTLNYEVALEVAEEIAAGKSGKNRREALVDASRILLDYGLDITGAVEYLISAEMWSEARRIASLHDRDDLVNMAIEAAVSYTSTLFTDFEERQLTFEKTSSRYVEVLIIRKQAIKEAGFQEEEMLEQGDETGSLFSVASTSSLRSTASTSSTGSVGSVASVSSVVSVGNQTTFTMTNESDRDKHRSKFNKLGKGKKKKKKKRGKGPGSRKVRPGSEEELKSLVLDLEIACVKADYASIVSDTITFLSQVGHIDLSHELFRRYERLREAINSCQAKRIAEAAAKRIESERTARREGTDDMPIVLKCEAAVDALQCKELSAFLHELYSFL